MSERDSDRPDDRRDRDSSPRDEGLDDREEREPGRRGLLERGIPGAVKRVVERAVESGVNRLDEGTEHLRNFVGDRLEGKLPKEALQYIYQQVDETKNGLLRVVAKEIRDVLEQTQFADELAKVLTKLSFEIKTEIRFIPNEKSTGKQDGEGLGMPKPEMKSEVNVRDRSKERGSIRPPPRREDE